VIADEHNRLVFGNILFSNYGAFGTAYTHQRTEKPFDQLLRFYVSPLLVFFGKLLQVKVIGNT
jgi:hypothetical protein